MDGACSSNGDRRNSYWVLAGKYEKRSLLEDLSIDGRIL
jgi:hypothetical protein